MTTVSIVMSVTNRPNHLRNTLKGWSLIDYPDFDFTVIDDCTRNPEIEQVVGEFKDRLPITFYAETEWHNMNVLWSKYGREAQGEYVIFAMMDEIISHKDIVQRMLVCPPDRRCSVFTYFMNQDETDRLSSLAWESDPRIIPKPLTTETAAGLISHITGNWKKNWEWFGWLRPEEKGHLWMDQDIHIREVCLGKGCHTVPDVYCLHQYHPESSRPADFTQPGFLYSTEAQARLLEPATREER